MGFSDIISGAGSLLGSFGGGDGPQASSGSSYSASGYAALPPEAQNAYRNYFNLVNGIGAQSPYQTPQGAFSFYNGNPNSPFTSQGLSSLQGANPNMGLNPSGFLEPFNQYQQNALSSFGNPDFSTQGLSQYTNPFQSMVTDQVLNEINRQSGIDRNNITDRASRLNSSAFNNSALGTQLSQNTDNTNRLRADATANLGFQGYNSALGLRSQTLQDQLNAGSAIQSQNQSALGYSNPFNYAQGQYQLNPQYAQASALAPLFGAFPSSSTGGGTQLGATPILSNGQYTYPNTTQRFGGFLSANANNIGKFLGF